MELLKDFKTGLYKRSSGYNYWNTYENVLCSCGHTFQNREGRRGRTCANCGNTQFKEVSGKMPTTRTLIDSIIIPIECLDKKIHVKKVEITALLENGQKIVDLKTGKEMEIVVDLKVGTIELYRNGEKIETNEDTLEEFSKNINDTCDFIKKVSTERSHNLFKFLLDQYGRTYNKEKYYRVHRVFTRLIKIPIYDVLYSCGFKPDFIDAVLQYDRSNTNETVPHKILGIPKYMIRYIKSFGSYDYRIISDLIKLDEMINGNNVKTILQIFDEESNVKNIGRIKDDLIRLYKDYGYKDLTKLSLYITRDVKLQQGIMSPQEAITILKDYVRMCKDMDVEWEKYPKSLKKDHDIALRNYNTKKDEIKQKKFAEVVEKEDYQRFVYKKDKEYTIVVPKEVKDIISEGESLSHCVASYVDDIIDGRCKIIFMRNKDSLDKSLLTIEIRNNENIRQIRGQSNRLATAKEMDFIRKYAEKLKLHIGTY